MNDNAMYDIPSFNPHQNLSAFSKLTLFQSSEHISHLVLKTLLVAKEKLQKVYQKQESYR